MQKRTLYALCLLAIMLVAACKKKNNNAAAPASNCRITGANIVDSGSSVEMISRRAYQYSGADRFLSGAQSYSSFDSTFETITRVGDTLFSVTKTLPSGVVNYDTAVVNSAGFMVWQSKHADDKYTQYTYSYDAAGQLTSIKTWNAIYDTLIDSVVFTWSGGDCVSQYSTRSNLTTATTFTYYTDIPASIGDLTTYLQQGDAKLIVNKHAIKSESVSGYYQLYTYQMDGNKVASALAATSTAPGAAPTYWQRITYTYDCQ